MSFPYFEVLTIPDHDTETEAPYPGGIEPGYYSLGELVEMLRGHADNPAAIRFIADMLEP